MEVRLDGQECRDHDQCRRAGRRQPEFDHRRSARARCCCRTTSCIEKLAHQNRERIPERIVHAKGCGRLRHADGHRRHHELHQGQSSCSRASKTRMLRALLDGGRRARRGRHRARCARLCAASSTPRTATGIWSATTRRCSSSAIPTSSPTSSTRRSAIPRTNLRSPTAMWDFWSLSPESLHQVTILMSRSRRCRRAYRHMNGFGRHTYSLHQRQERALLGQVPLQDAPGHQALDQQGSRPRSSDGPRVDAAGPVRRDREGRLPELEAAGAGHAGGATPASTGTTRSTSPRSGRTPTIR